jgi:hypothetical protein
VWDPKPPGQRRLPIDSHVKFNMEAYGDFEIVRVPPWLPKILQGVSKFHGVSMRFSMISMGIWNFDDISKTVRPSVFLTRFSILLTRSQFSMGNRWEEKRWESEQPFSFSIFPALC